MVVLQYFAHTRFIVQIVITIRLVQCSMAIKGSDNRKSPSSIPTNFGLLKVPSFIRGSDFLVMPGEAINLHRGSYIPNRNIMEVKLPSLISQTRHRMLDYNSTPSSFWHFYSELSRPMKWLEIDIHCLFLLCVYHAKYITFSLFTFLSAWECLRFFSAS